MASDPQTTRAATPGKRLDEMEPIMQARLAAAKATGWQPIETAPRDGTHILVGWGRWSASPPTVAHWFDDGWHLSFNRNGDRSDLSPRIWLPTPEQPA